MDTEQRNAIKALAQAAKTAKSLSRFVTPAGVLSEQEAEADDRDDVFGKIETIAQACFGSSLDDFEREIAKRFKVSGQDVRVGDLYSLHVDEVRAQTLAAFAMGVAFGQLQKPTISR